MITVREIERATMTNAKRKEAHNNYFAFYIGRPLSYLLTIPFLYTNITPNTITFISMILLMIGYLCFQFANGKAWFFIGWIFFFLWNLFDGVDGNVARYKKQFSENGDLWDTTAGYMAMVTTFMAAGVCAAKTNSSILFQDDLYYILGAWTAIFSIFPRLVLHKKASSNLNSDSVHELRDKGSFSCIKIIALNLISITGFLQLIWLICIIFDKCTFFILSYFFINLIIMVVSLYKLLKESK